MNEGESFGLVGETGCGKSVTARTILRILDENGFIKSGSIEFRGQNLLELSDKEMTNKIRGKEIGMIFQDPRGSLDPVYTVGYQIIETLRENRKLREIEAKESALEMIKTLRIGESRSIFNSYPLQLSAGMSQRAISAVMISSYPSLLIADEPTSALDVTIQAQFLKLLKELKRDFGISLLLITHNMAVVAEICDRVGVMYSGSVVEIANTLTIFEEAVHPYTKALIGAIPKKAKRGKLKTIPGIVPDPVNPPTGCRFHPRCKNALEKCSEEKPKLIEIEAGHKVACHLFSP